MKAKRRITSFNFEKATMESGALTHVALVDKAANLTEAVIMKAKAPTVQVTMELDSFLQRFFGMWEEDAEALINILGYTEPTDDEIKPDDDYQSYDEEKGCTKWVSGVGYTDTEGYIKHKIGTEVTLLKGKELPKELPQSIHATLSDLQKSIGEALDTSEQDSELHEETGSTDLDLNKDKKGGDSMPTKLTPEQIADLQKQAALATDLQKSLETAQSKVADFEKAQAAAAKATMTELVKGFTFIGEDDQEDVIKSLLSNKDAVVLATFQKAQAAIDEFATAEHGTDATEDLEKSAAQQSNDDFDAIASDVMKSRKANKGAK